MVDLERSERRKRDIQRDFTSFADPDTTVDVTEMARRYRVAWVSRGEKKEATFSALTDNEYRAVVAGPQLADLRGMAEMIRRTSRPRGSEAFIDTNARRENPNSSPRPAIDVLSELLETDSGDATRVTMLTGDAGMGKTRVLRELVYRQADKYLRGQTTKLLLYVNAQGRALARLNEALATELQDLRVGLTYHSVAVLARLGILVPVIDGFDELLGVSGYDDAFGSLARFLEQLEGRGQLLVAARSVYYEAEFLERAPGVDAEIEQAWEHVPVRLIGWNDKDREDYLADWMRRKGVSEEDGMEIRERMKKIFSGANADLASRPLFFTRSVEILRTHPEFSYDDPLQGLSNRYVSRELEDKLLDRNSRPLLTEKQFRRLMREFAEDMWNQDTRELDYGSIREIAEHVAEDEGLSETARSVVIERFPTLAFLGQGGRSGSRTGAFEHELFFFYFLGQLIASRLGSGEGDMGLFLSRSALPEEVAERVAQELWAAGGCESNRLEAVIERLVKASKTEWLRTSQVRENAGLLIMALFRKVGEIENCIVESVDFPGSNLKDVSLTRCLLTDMTIRRTDLTSTRFLDCEVSDTFFVEPRLGCATRLGLQGASLQNFIGVRDRSDEVIYDPREIANILERYGISISDEAVRSGRRSIPAEYIKVLERLMRAYGRANPVCKDDYNLTAIFNNPAWEDVEKLLVEYELVVSELRHPGGSAKIFLRRRFSTKQLMAGMNRNARVDRKIWEFWQALESATRDDA